MATEDCCVWRRRWNIKNFYQLFCQKSQCGVPMPLSGDGRRLEWAQRTQTVTAPPPQIFSSKPPFQLGAPWRLPSRQPLIMSLHEPRFARHIYRGESLREVFSFYTFTGGKEKSHHDNFFSLFFFLLASLFRENSASGREEKTRRETRHTLIRQGSLPLLFHLPEFTSALILEFFVQPLQFLKSWRFHRLSGQDYKKWNCVL